MASERVVGEGQSLAWFPLGGAFLPCVAERDDVVDVDLAGAASGRNLFLLKRLGRWWGDVGARDQASSTAPSGMPALCCDATVRTYRGPQTASQKTK